MRNIISLKLESDSGNSEPGILELDYNDGYEHKDDHTVELCIEDRAFTVNALELIKAIDLIKYQMSL